MPGQQIATEQRAREEQDQYRKGQRCPHAGSTPRCRQLGQSRGYGALRRSIARPAHSLCDESYQDESGNQQYWLDRAGPISDFYPMLAGLNRNRAEIGVHTKYWGGLSINGRLLAWKVSDLKQRVAWS